ncbi:MAG: flavodoxin family protein [Solirubrobacterales bacterium]
MSSEIKPRALIVFFTFTRQTGRVAEVMNTALTEKGYEVAKSAIEFTDPHWTKLFSTFPMRRPALRIPTILVAQRRRKVGQIRVPEAARTGDYDLVLIGSPTWWLTTSMPVRSFLSSPSARNVLEGKPFAAFSVSRRYWKGNMHDVRQLGEAFGGRWLGETHFTADGGQIRSMLSWLSYMKRGTSRGRILGVKMPKPNLSHDFEQQARSFIDRIAAQAADRAVVTTSAD